MSGSRLSRRGWVDRALSPEKAANPAADRPDGSWVHFLGPSALGNFETIADRPALKGHLGGSDAQHPAAHRPERRVHFPSLPQRALWPGSQRPLGVPGHYFQQLNSRWHQEPYQVAGRREGRSTDPQTQPSTVRTLAGLTSAGPGPLATSTLPPSSSPGKRLRGALGATRILLWSGVPPTPRVAPWTLPTAGQRYCWAAKPRGPLPE